MPWPGRSASSVRSTLIEATCNRAGTPISSPITGPRQPLAIYHILQAGGLGTGGFNFDAKVRRQSLDPVDLLYAHIGGMDVCARGLLAAAAMIEDGSLAEHVRQRYASWDSEQGQAVLDGARSLEELAALVDRTGLEPQPVSGRQEYLENLVNRFV